MRLARILFPFLYPRRDASTKNDYNNIVQSIARCKRLYKKLSVLAHPDKHPNKVELANSIMEQINTSRFDYQKLKELEKRINYELS